MFPVTHACSGQKSGTAANFVQCCDLFAASMHAPFDSFVLRERSFTDLDDRSKSFGRFPLPVVVNRQ